MGRPTKEQQEAKLAEQTKPVVFTEIPEGVSEKMLMQQHIDKLEEAISRIAHVTGSHNYISELGIKRWTPGKKYMGKKYG